MTGGDGGVRVLGLRSAGSEASRGKDQREQSGENNEWP